MKINLRQIEAFRLVFQTGSMTTAAKLMSVTQPAISRLIRDLEAHTQLSLFTRTGTGLASTQDAVLFYNEVERSFLGLQHVANAALAIRENREKLIHIATTGAFAYQCIPKALTFFRGRWPLVSIKLTVTRSSEILELVATRQCDMGVTVIPPNPPGIEHEPLPHFPVVCILPVGHRLAKKQVVTPDDLAGEALFIPPRKSLLQQEVARAFEAAGVPMNVMGEFSLGSAICEMVAQGSAVSVLDALSAKGAGYENVIVRPFEPAMEFRPKLIFPAGVPRSKPLTVFAKAIESRLAELRTSFA